MSSFVSLFFFFFFFAPISSIAKASVPRSATFKYVITGEFGPYVVEYGGNYRMILQIFNSPFQLGYYNTTPNAFTLALRMGLLRSESRLRWVWEFNRGKPVRENATFALGTNGNLVLAEADGSIVWQSNSAKKGVVGFDLLPNGNMVLYDSKGQALRVVGGINKLVTRKSEKKNVNGPNSLALEPKGLSVYYNSPGPPLIYFTSSQWGIQQGSIEYVMLKSDPETYKITLEYHVANSSSAPGRLLLEIQIGKTSANYERCNKFGVCDDNQCVACPSEEGELLGWSKECEARKVNSCDVKDFHYYKLEGVDHFMTKYNSGNGVMKVDECGKKCSGDCKCLGYFYHRETSKCWIAYNLMTLSKVPNSTHLGYIKVPNKK
ncbi:hypothetical protein Ddye_011687 [Dipteronia dyeriana]|uniref:Bulb-type lectin domain-containing protein n=1 Tax=Dipteronia dyeriana TaxID=168575 RepID=A0AAD9X2Z7_9ROSI|nr:hypothetical protein Ddye_011687 [Dipteronia dyeriana]